jgi:hypothetical protein
LRREDGGKYNARDFPKPSAICREIHEIGRAAAGAPRDGRLFPPPPPPPAPAPPPPPAVDPFYIRLRERRANFYFPRRAQRRQRGSARFLGISAGSLGRRVIAAACGPCAPVS